MNGKVFSLLGVLFLLGILTGCGKQTVDLNKYVTVTVQGYDSVGTAECDFDYDLFKKDYSGKIKAENSKELEEWGLTEDDVAEVFLEMCVSHELDRNSGLSNGDVIHLTWNCDDKTAEESFNVKLKYADIEHAVTELEEVDKFDPFEYIEVSFIGISPEGEAVIEPDYDRPEMQYMRFSTDKSTVKNGDTLIITAQTGITADEFVEKYGVIPGKTEKEYEVAGLPEYISKISDIPEEAYSKMDKRLKDAFDAHVAEFWDNKDAVQKFELIGNYLLTKKEDSWWADDYNRLYYIYKVLMDTQEGPFSYYWYGCYADTMLTPEGTVEYGECVLSESDSDWFGTSGDYLACDSEHYVAGFADLKSFAEEYVTSVIDNYEYEKNINEPETETAAVTTEEPENTENIVTCGYIRIELPDGWVEDGGIYECTSDEPDRYSMRFSEKVDYDQSHTGYLRSLLQRLRKDSSEEELWPGYDHIGEIRCADGSIYDVLLIRPTDVQFMPETQELYEQLLGELTGAIRNLEAINGAEFVPD